MDHTIGLVERLRNGGQTDLADMAADLVNALDSLLEAADSMQATYGRINGKTPEHDDLFVHEQWAEGFLSERANAARAAIKSSEAA